MTAPVTDFRSPQASLGTLDPAIAAQLIKAGSDVALVLDDSGIIRDVAFGSQDLSNEGYADWLGRSWDETVTIDSRPKIRQLLKDAANGAAPRWRQVNHHSARGEDVPVRYMALDVRHNGRIVAIGRDLRAIATLQQRLIQVQGSMEREYARLRQMETRYRMLFEASSEPVLIIDLGTGRVSEANAAALDAFGRRSKQMIGKPFAEFFDKAERKDVQAALSAGRAEDLPVHVGEESQRALLSGSTFRNDNTAYLLARLSLPARPAAGAGTVASLQLHRILQNMPEGFVITDPDLTILMANPAFLDFAHAPSEDHVRGEKLDRFIGRSEVDMTVLAQNLRQYGFIRQFGTVFRGPFGDGEEVYMAAVAVTDGEHPCFGFTIRSAASQLAPPKATTEKSLLGTADELSALVGRMSLKEIVRETTDIIERLCIQVALDLTSDNRASAAEMLGLSRQSLYAKLRRHGMQD